MRLCVLFFGVLRERFGPEEQLQQFPGSSVADLLRYYRVIAPELDVLWNSVAVAVNRQYAGGVQQLEDDDEVALLPPVSGGSPDGERTRVELVRGPIDTQRLVDDLKQGDDGAVVVFDGIVRNNTRGRQTLYLDYTAFESMAIQQLQDLRNTVLRQFSVRNLLIIHRLGRLEIGETSILIAVASAHRGAAFDACRWLIDTLKQQVPIWKKEVFVDGAVWAPGEPFPAALSPHESSHQPEPLTPAPRLSPSS